MKFIALFLFSLSLSTVAFGGNFRLEVIASKNATSLRLNNQTYPIEEGYADIQLTIDKPQYAELQVEGTTKLLYLEPASDLKLNLTTKESPFEGKLKNENSLINGKQYHYDVENIETSIKQNVALVEAVGNKKFSDLEKKRITFTTKCTAMRKTDFNSAIVSDPTFQKFCYELIAGDDEMIETPDYILKVMSCVKRMNEYTFKGVDRNHVDQVALNINYFKTIKEHIYPKSPRVAELVAEIIGDNYIRGNKSDETINQLYHSIVKDEKRKVNYLNYYSKWQKVKPGEKMPDLAGVDLNGKIVRISDFKGKVIYLDLWYSGCGPCRKEIREGSPVLHEQFKDRKDLVFIYASVDSKEALWREAVEKDGAEGVHLLVNSPENKEMLEQLTVISFPRYIIIDKKGRIADVQAPRPSNPKTEGLIKKIL